MSPQEECAIRMESYRSRDGKVGETLQLGNEGMLVGYKLSRECMRSRMILAKQITAIQSLLVVGSHEQGEYSPVSRLFMSSSESSKS